MLTFPFSTLEKYSSEPLGSAFIVLEPSLQLAGQTSPYFSCRMRIAHVRHVAETTKRTRDTYDELERLDETDGLVDGAADGEVVDGDLAEDTLRVDDEEAAESDTLLLEEDAVVAGDLQVLVGNERKLEVRAQATL